MIIKELYIAEFGGIKNKKIEFGNDKMLNVIYGENESGKSTVFLFIKFMLYGLQRKSQSNTERERSLSWSGSVASGSMTVEHEGKEYRIERNFSDRVRGEKLTILSLDSGTPVLTNKSVGEFFLGVPREVFESSACVSQMCSGEVNGEKTAQSLSNMLSSADEDVNTAAILKELNAIRVSYLHKNQGGGMLFDDEAKINSLRLKLDEAKNATLAIEGKTESFDKVKKEHEALKRELEKNDALVTQFNKISVLKRFEALKLKEEELATVVGKKDVFAKATLTTDYFPNRTYIAELSAASRELAERESLLDAKEKKLAEHIKNYNAELASLGEIAEKNGGKNTIVPPLREAIKKAYAKIKGGIAFGAGALVSGIFGALSLFLINPVVFIVAICIAFALASAATVLLVIGSKAKKSATDELKNVAYSYDTNPDGLEDRIDEAINELSRMRAYNAEHEKLVSEEDFAEEAFEASKQRAYKLLMRTMGDNAEPECDVINTEVKRLSEFLDKYDALSREEDTFKRIVENERASLARYNEEKLRSEITVRIEDATAEAVEEAERRKSFLLAKKNAYDSKMTILQNELIALRIKAEDPMPIADRLAILEEKNKKDREFYDALLLAMNVIEDSSAAMRGSVTPIISKTASEFMSVMSNDKYSTLRTNSKLGIMLDKDGFAVASEYLSAGTKDAAYIALRMALIMHIYKSERPPIIFDESFCQLDDTRLGRAMELLFSLVGEGIQVIIFTSHKREAEACRKANFDFNEITF